METNDQVVMAEWWRRLAALVIDTAVLWIPTMLVTRSNLVPLLALIPFLGLVIWLADGLWPLWDQRRQALHDKLAGSAVVPAS